ncbi:hypothetical protein AAFC00_002516 [Neodothiora populina]|uniref:F-box domain-containing protein n=1 Tax=Neodothiora populina TaxID=2781224 RepID=A0ABR3P7M7_9PEZI
MNKPRPKSVAAAPKKPPAVGNRNSLSHNFNRPQHRPNTPSNVLASLRATQILVLKPVLSAELIATIVDYLPVPDLLRCARASKRLQEMVYDDTRWVQKLKAMGVWNEAEARQRHEEAIKRKVESHRPKDADGNGVNGGAAHGRPHSRGITIFDAGVEEERYRRSLEQPMQPLQPLQHQPPTRHRHGSSADGFDDVTMSSSRTRASMDPKLALSVLRRVRSVRGQARQEYGKIHGCLAPFYLDLAESENQEDLLISKTYQNPEEQARIFADLKVFARSDTASGFEERAEKLASVTGVFENSMLQEFEQAYQAQDNDRMRKYAHVLVTLNGGAAATDYFISNHPYMLHKEQLPNPLECIDGVATGHVDLEPARKFFEKLASMLTSQSAVIDHVFPSQVDVLLAFVERTCEDIVADYLTTLFDEAHRSNKEMYLKAVSGVYSQALRFAASIQPSKASSKDFTKDVRTIVARCFEPHVDLYLTEELNFFQDKSEGEVAAWERELSEQEARTESFFMSNVSRQAAKRDFLSSFKKVVMMPVNALPAFPSSNRQSVAAAPAVQETPGEQPTSGPSTPALGINSTVERSNTPVSEKPTTELAAKTAIMNSKLEGIKGLFSIEVALSLIHKAKASIERAAIFVHADGEFSTRAREQCETIFVTLLTIVGRQHVQNGFDKAVHHLSGYKPREVRELRGQQLGDPSAASTGVEPLVTFLELVNVGDLIQQMVDVFYVQELVAAKLTDRDDFLNPAVKEKKRFEQMLDERVAAGMSKGIDVLMDEVEYMCATLQQTTDFNPGVDKSEKNPRASGIIDIGPTETAKRVVETISSHTGMLVGSTDKNMLDVFNQEVGLRLFGVLCKHIKRQRISVDGAIKLISDINAYSTFVATLRQKALLPYYSALRELSQLYLVDCTSAPTASLRSAQAKELATIIADNDRYKGIFGAEEVYEFAERRADWYSVRGDVERAMYGVGCLLM